MTVIPWSDLLEVACGLITGVVYARTTHLARAINQRGFKSRCAWCGGHLVDLRDPGAQESMQQHVVRCPERPAVRS